MLPISKPSPFERTMTTANSPGDAGTQPQEVVLSEGEHAKLECRAAGYMRPRREVLRASLVLLAAEGKANPTPNAYEDVALLARTLNVERHPRRPCPALERLGRLDAALVPGCPTSLSPDQQRNGQRSPHGHVEAA